MGQRGTTAHRSTAHNSPVTTMRPANIDDLMIGNLGETQMTGVESHRPLFISRHATATKIGILLARKVFCRAVRAEPSP